MLIVTTLGRFDIQLDGRTVNLPSRPAQSVLAYLLLHANQMLRREQLAGIFWPASSESSARSNLRHALWRIRKALENADDYNYVSGDDLAVSLILQEGDRLDLAVFRAPGSGLEDLEHQTAAYGGEFLPGFYEEWVILEREHLQMQFEQKMARLVALLARRQQWNEVRQEAERWICLSSAPEPAYRLLMLALVALGDPSGAAAAYERCKQSLQREAGLQPAEKTSAVYQYILAGWPAEKIFAQLNEFAGADRWLNPDQPATPGEPPYMGLKSYGEEEQGLFFGRSQLVEKLAGRLKKEKFLAIIGASGSGKSSLLRAGLAPVFRKGARAAPSLKPALAWQVILLTPGANPLKSLAAALLHTAADDPASESLAAKLAAGPQALPHWRQDAAAPLLVMVDQFEELFSLCHHAEQRQAFIENLLSLIEDGAQLCRVVIALRADYYPHCAYYSGLRDALAHSQEYIGPMNATELRQAIEKPAEAGRWNFEQGLVELLLHDVGHEDGRLPLLSHALLETWRRRSGRTLTLAGYAAAGGIHTAIGRSAEAVYQKFSPRQQTFARAIFLRLIEIQDTESGTSPIIGTRRRAAIQELLSIAAQEPGARQEIEYVLNALVAARLVATGQNTAEIIHEALIQEWPTLRQWLLEDRQGLLIQRRLTESAQNWESFNRDDGELYRNARLFQALEWVAAHPDEPTALEREFLDASQAYAGRDAAEREAQHQRQLTLERRTRRVLLIFTAALLLAAVFLSTLAWWANTQRQEARRQASIGLASAAAQHKGKDSELAALLAIEALENYPYTAQAQQALADVVQSALPVQKLDLSAGPSNTYCQAWGPPNAKSASPGNQLACVGDMNSQNQRLLIWNEASGKIVQSLPLNLMSARVFAWSADGARILSQLAKPGWSGSDLQLIDLQSGSQFTITTNGLYPGAFGWLPDGESIFAATASSVDFWNADSGQPMLSIIPQGAPAFNQNMMQFSMEPWLAVAPSPDGKWFAIAMIDGTVQVYALPDGSLAYTLGAPNPTYTVKPFDVLNPLLTEPISDSISARMVQWSPDGQRLAVTYALRGGSTSATVLVWNTTEKLVEYSLAASDLVGVQWIPGGNEPQGQNTLLVLRQGALSIWDRAGERLRLETPISQLSISPDGHWLMDRRRIFDLWQLPHVLPQNGAQYVKWSPDGQRLATTNEIFTLSAGQENGALFLPEMYTDVARLRTGTVSWAPDGRRAVVNRGLYRAPFIMDTQNGEVTGKIAATAGQCLPTMPYENCSFFSTSIWSPASANRIASASAGFTSVKHRIFFWDAQSGDVLAQTPDINCMVYSLSFSPDGRWLASDCQTVKDPSDPAQRAAAQIWDAQTGAPLHELFQEKETPKMLAWSPDGSQVAVGYQSGLVILWDATTWQPVFTFAGHSRQVVSLDWSPNSRYVLSISGEYGEPGQALAWEAASGEIIQAFAMKDCVNLCTGDWSPDGKWFAFSNMKIYRAWTDKDALIAYAKEYFIQRTLTPAERELFGLGR